MKKEIYTLNKNTKYNKNEVPNTIKNIIFDVGDVLLEYRWKDMLMDKGLSEDEAVRIGTMLFDDPLWHEFDLAEMSDAEVIQAYIKKYPQDAEIIEWFITHGEQMPVARQDVWDKMHELKECGYGIYLLSNYSKDLFEKHTKGASFFDDIDGKVVSYQIHITKPDRRIYQYLLDQYDLDPAECIFFDDRADNTDAAEKMGMQTATITSKAQLLELMEELIEKADAFTENSSKETENRKQDKIGQTC